MNLNWSHLIVCNNLIAKRDEEFKFKSWATELFVIATIASLLLGEKKINQNIHIVN